MSKKIGNIMLILLLAASFVACSDDKNESKLEVKEAVAVEMVSDNVESSDKVLQKEQPEVQPEEKPSGIHEDGMGYDPDYGEGIGEVIALSDEEKSYVLTQTTNTWLEMEKTEKDELVVLIGRWLEETRGYIVPDYDELVMMLDHQMEQYYRNDVDEGVFDTVIDILGIE